MGKEKACLVLLNFYNTISERKKEMPWKPTLCACAQLPAGGCTLLRGEDKRALVQNTSACKLPRLCLIKEKSSVLEWSVLSHPKHPILGTESLIYIYRLVINSATECLLTAVGKTVIYSHRWQVTTTSLALLQEDHSASWIPLPISLTTSIILSSSSGQMSGQCVKPK